MSEAVAPPVGVRAETTPATTSFLGRFNNPWRKPRFLKAFTWMYLAWSILPVLIAVLISFNCGRSRAIIQLNCGEPAVAVQEGAPTELERIGRWWIYDPVDSVWHDQVLRKAIFQSLRLSLLVTLIATPIGVAFALGIDRWRGRGSGSANFLVLLSFVVPELILGVSLFIVFTQALKFVGLGTLAQVLGLVTFQISYPVIIVRARLISIGKEYEEAAMDLGASPLQALRKVLFPMLLPAIFVSAVLVFADVIDDFIIVRYLSLGAGTEPMSVKIYSAARGAPTPAINAMATIMLVSTLLVVGIGAIAYKRFTKAEKGTTVKELVQI
ncbi:MAG: ABC transporter permease [Actinomycetota bacterium]